MTRAPYRLAALVVALCALLLPAAAQASPQAVIRDCKVDGDLDHKYSNEDLRKAEDNLPADVDEYSDCREIIAGAVTGGSDRGGGRDTGGSGGGATAAGAGGAVGKQREKQARADDKAKLDAITGDRTRKPRVTVGGQPVQPGSNGLFDVASATNGLPLPLLLALIAALLLAAGGALIALRRRVPALRRIPLPSKLSLPRVPIPRPRR